MHKFVTWTNIVPEVWAQRLLRPHIKGIVPTKHSVAMELPMSPKTHPACCTWVFYIRPRNISQRYHHAHPHVFVELQNHSHRSDQHRRRNTNTHCTERPLTTQTLVHTPHEFCSVPHQQCQHVLFLGGVRTACIGVL